MSANSLVTALGGEAVVSESQRIFGAVAVDPCTNCNGR